MAASLPLRPIHPTATPSWWPPAPGWWLLAGLVVLVLAALVAWRWRRARRERRWATAFDMAMAATDATARLADASTWLRRAARQRDPASALLDGEAWLAWLDGDDPSRPFTQGPGRALTDAAFRPTVDAAQVEAALIVIRARYLALRVGR